MPIYDAPLVCKRPVVGFGIGDIRMSVGTGLPGSPNDPHWLLIHEVEPGPIGFNPELERPDQLADTSTEEHPADFAFYFAKEESLDVLISVLQEIKASFASSKEAV